MPRTYQPIAQEEGSPGVRALLDRLADLPNVDPRWLEWLVDLARSRGFE